MADSSDVVVASGARYAVQASDTVQSLSGAGSVELASGVTLTQTLPAGTSFVSVSDTANCANVGQVVTCTQAAMAPGGGAA